MENSLKVEIETSQRGWTLVVSVDGFAAAVCMLSNDVPSIIAALEDATALLKRKHPRG